MRVVSGVLKGRQIRSPNSAQTHPMGDKIRSAIFSVLGDIDGLTVLDAFTGSGAIGIEAISRGAALVCAIDKDEQVARTAQQNCDVLGISDRIDVIRVDAGQWSQAHPGAYYDIVVLDPPYDAVRVALLQQLANHVTPDNGTLVLSLPKDFEQLTFPGLSLAVEKSYGDATIRFYKRV